MAKYEVLQDCDVDERYISVSRKVGEVFETGREDVYIEVLKRNNIIKKIED
jgi:hypothetical protein